jgi:hypothetical protein
MARAVRRRHSTARAGGALSRAPGERLSANALREIERDEAVLRAALATLLRRGLIEQNGDGYRVVVPLAAEYVRRTTIIGM